MKTLSLSLFFVMIAVSCASAHPEPYYYGHHTAPWLNEPLTVYRPQCTDRKAWNVMLFAAAKTRCWNVRYLGRMQNPNIFVLNVCAERKYYQWIGSIGLEDRFMDVSPSF